RSCGCGDEGGRTRLSLEDCRQREPDRDDPRDRPRGDYLRFDEQRGPLDAASSRAADAPRAGRAPAGGAGQDELGDRRRSLPGEEDGRANRRDRGRETTRAQPSSRGGEGSRAEGNRHPRGLAVHSLALPGAAPCAQTATAMPSISTSKPGWRKAPTCTIVLAGYGSCRYCWRTSAIFG